MRLAVEVTDGRQMRHEADWPLRWETERRQDIRSVESPEELFSVPAVKLLARAGTQDPDVFVKLVGRRRGRAGRGHPLVVLGPGGDLRRRA